MINEDADGNVGVWGNIIILILNYMKFMTNLKFSLKSTDLYMVHVQTVV